MSDRGRGGGKGGGQTRGRGGRQHGGGSGQQGGASGGGYQRSGVRGQQGGGGGEGGRSCFKCGKEGHMSRECPQGGGGGGGYQQSGGSGHQGGGRGGGGGGGRSCFKCGKEGHMSRECPQGGSSGGGHQQSGGSGHQGGYQRTGGGGGYHSGGGQQASGSGGGYRDARERRDSGSSGGRGQGGNQYGGGGRERGGGAAGPSIPAAVSFIESSACPNPYLQPYTEAQKKLQEPGWKAFDAKTKEDVTLQKYGGKPASWHDRKIHVSVNHFLVENKKDPKVFPIPTFYHYDISYEIIRPPKDEATAPSPSTSKGGKGSKKKAGNKRKVESDPVDVLSTQMDEATIEEGDAPNPKKKKGEAPPNKKLPKDLTNRVLPYLLEKISRETGHYGILTDGRFNMFSTKKVHGADSSVPNFALEHHVTFQELKAAGWEDDDDSRTIKVIFTPSLDKTGTIHTIDTCQIAELFKKVGTLKGLSLSADTRQSVEAVANALVRTFPNFRFFSVGRSTMVPWEPKDKTDLGGGICAWKGVSANIAMGWKPYLNVDIANCAFMQDRNVLDVLSQVLDAGQRRQRFKVADIATWNPKDFDDARSLLKTTKIRYEVNGKRFSGNVTNVLRNGASTETFPWERQAGSGKTENISVFNYYQQNYNKTLQYQNGLLLEIRKKAKVPAELCSIKKGQSYNRKLDGQQTTKMLISAKKNPDVLKTATEAEVADMKLEENPVLKELGIQVSNEMLQFKEARVLVPPTLRYGSKKPTNDLEAKNPKIAHIEPNDGTWDIWKHADFSFFTKRDNIKKWGILFADCKIRDKADLNRFINGLNANALKKNLRCFESQPTVIISSAFRWNFSPEENRAAFQNHFQNDFSGCQLVIVILQQKGSPLYGYMKHAAEVDVGILTQCVTQDNLLKCQGATIQNILLKINSKLGGINYVVVAPFKREKAEQFANLITDCPLLILGADVTHAPPGSKKILSTGKEFIMPSYAAVTGNVNKTCMPYMTEVRAQRKANAGAAEVIQDLDEIVLKMLKRFEAESKKQNVLPMKIIYFRDGVGAGQFPELLHVEMNAIRKACTLFRDNYEPKITFITVQKRHKARMFHYTEHGIVNAPAGTVIDQEIVHPTETDFYLLSHRGAMGTSRPSRYHVLWDDSDLSQDVIQSLAYTLCYMYVRCTKSVKYPAPTYYAHLAAERAKKICENLEERGGDPNQIENLNGLLRRNEQLLDNFPMHFV